MKTFDISSIGIHGNDINYELTQRRETEYNKSLQLWLKFFIGSTGRIGRLQKNKTNPEIITLINRAIILANNKLIDRQGGMDLSKSEKFVGASLKFLDITARGEDIKIEIFFKTENDEGIIFL